MRVKKFTILQGVLFLSILLIAGCPSKQATPPVTSPSISDNTSVVDEDVASAQSSTKSYGDITIDRLVSIYDGDTFHVDIAGWPDIVGKNVSIRVNGIDTPERRDKRENIKRLAQAAKELVVTRLRAAESIELRNMQRGKYFRIVADVYVDGESLADILIEQGLAKPYDGGTKIEWSEADSERYFNGRNTD